MESRKAILKVTSSQNTARRPILNSKHDEEENCSLCRTLSRKQPLKEYRQLLEEAPDINRRFLLWTPDSWQLPGKRRLLISSHIALF